MRRELIAELALQDLAGRRCGAAARCDDRPCVGHLERGQPLADVGLQLVGGRASSPGSQAAPTAATSSPSRSWGTPNTAASCTRRVLVDARPRPRRSTRSRRPAAPCPWPGPRRRRSPRRRCGRGRRCAASRRRSSRRSRRAGSSSPRIRCGPLNQISPRSPDRHAAAVRVADVDLEDRRRPPGAGRVRDVVVAASSAGRRRWSRSCRSRCPGSPSGSSTATRFTSSGGAGAPPPPTLTQARRVEARRSVGDSSRSQLCVGTPTKFVTCSRSISSRARVGSHLYIITSFSPLATHDSMHRHARR